MPEIVTCPNCGRKLNVRDDLLGRNVKCPGCGRKFLAAVDDAGRFLSGRDDAPPPRDYDDYDDRPRRRSRDDYDDEYREPERRREVVEPSRGEIRQGWERVRMGVNLVIIAMWIAIGALVLALIVGLLLMLYGAFTFASIFDGFNSGSPPTAPQAASTGCAIVIGLILLWGVLILCGLAYAALRITGLGFCMGIPPTRKTQGLKGLSIATFCLAIGGLLLPLMFVGADFAFAESSIAGCAIFMGNLLSGLVGLAEFICFFLLLRGVAVAMRKDALAQNLVIYMVVVPVFVLIAVGSFFVLPLIAGALFFNSVASSSSPGGAVGNATDAISAMFVGGLVCSGLFVLIGIALFVWYLVLLHQVRGAIDDWLDRR